MFSADLVFTIFFTFIHFKTTAVIYIIHSSLTSYVDYYYIPGVEAEAAKAKPENIRAESSQENLHCKFFSSFCKKTRVARQL